MNLWLSLELRGYTHTKFGAEAANAKTQLGFKLNAYDLSTVLPDGTLITVEDDPERLSWLAADGTVLGQIDTLTLDPPLSEPQGIARDPRTGHLLVVDDWEGSNSLYELDAEGRLLGSLPLIRYGMDPEGIALRPGSGQVFIAFDSGATIASFDYTPTLPSDADPLPPGADCMLY